MDVHPDTIPYTARVKHDGTLYAIEVASLHVLKCRSCGEVLFDSVTDEQISQSLRDHLQLLSPREIRDKLNALSLTQKEFAQRLRLAPETVSRWLSGAYIQSASSDTLMRLFFEREEASRMAANP